MQLTLNRPAIASQIKATINRMVASLNASLTPATLPEAPVDLSMHAYRLGHHDGLMVHPYVMYDLVTWDNSQTESQRLDAFLTQVGRAVRRSGYTETWFTHEAIPRNNSNWHAQPHRLVARWQTEDVKWLVTYQ